MKKVDVVYVVMLDVYNTSYSSYHIIGVYSDMDKARMGLKKHFLKNSKDTTIIKEDPIYIECMAATSEEAYRWHIVPRTLDDKGEEGMNSEFEFCIFNREDMEHKAPQDNWDNW